MPKTRQDVIAMAHRRLAILTVGEAPSADQEQFAGDVLDGLIQELNDTRHLLLSNMTFDDSVFLPMSYLLASEIAPHYNIPGEPRGRCMIRLTAVLRPDNRADQRDLNKDGQISDGERDIGDAAGYF